MKFNLKLFLCICIINTYFNTSNTSNPTPGFSAFSLKSGFNSLKSSASKGVFSTIKNLFTAIRNTGLGIQTTEQFELYKSISLPIEFMRMIATVDTNTKLTNFEKTVLHSFNYSLKTELSLSPFDMNYTEADEKKTFVRQTTDEITKNIMSKIRDMLPNSTFLNALVDSSIHYVNGNTEKISWTNRIIMKLAFNLNDFVNKMRIKRNQSTVSFETELLPLIKNITKNTITEMRKVTFNKFINAMKQAPQNSKNNLFKFLNNVNNMFVGTPPSEENDDDFEDDSPIITKEDIGNFKKLALFMDESIFDEMDAENLTLNKFITKFTTIIKNYQEEMKQKGLSKESWDAFLQISSGKIEQALLLQIDLNDYNKFNTAIKTMIKDAWENAPIEAYNNYSYETLNDLEESEIKSIITNRLLEFSTDDYNKLSLDPLIFLQNTLKIPESSTLEALRQRALKLKEINTIILQKTNEFIDSLNSITAQNSSFTAEELDNLIDSIPTMELLLDNSISEDLKQTMSKSFMDALNNYIKMGNRGVNNNADDLPDALITLQEDYSSYFSSLSNDIIESINSDPVPANQLSIPELIEEYNNPNSTYNADAIKSALSTAVKDAPTQELESLDINTVPTEFQEPLFTNNNWTQVSRKTLLSIPIDQIKSIITAFEVNNSQLTLKERFKSAWANASSNDLALIADKISEIPEFLRPTIFNNQNWQTVPDEILATIPNAWVNNFESSIKNKIKGTFNNLSLQDLIEALNNPKNTGDIDFIVDKILETITNFSTFSDAVNIINSSESSTSSINNYLKKQMVNKLLANEPNDYSELSENGLDVIKSIADSTNKTNIDSIIEKRNQALTEQPESPITTSAPKSILKGSGSKPKGLNITLDPKFTPNTQPEELNNNNNGKLLDTILKTNFTDDLTIKNRIKNMNQLSNISSSIKTTDNSELITRFNGKILDGIQFAQEQIKQSQNFLSQFNPDDTSKNWYELFYNKITTKIESKNFNTIAKQSVEQLLNSAQQFLNTNIEYIQKNPTTLIQSTQSFEQLQNLVDILSHGPNYTEELQTQLSKKAMEIPHQEGTKEFTLWQNVLESIYNPLPTEKPTTGWLEGERLKTLLSKIINPTINENNKNPDKYEKAAQKLTDILIEKGISIFTEQGRAYAGKGIINKWINNYINKIEPLKKALKDELETRKADSTYQKSQIIDGLTQALENGATNLPEDPGVLTRIGNSFKSAWSTITSTINKWRPKVTTSSSTTVELSPEFTIDLPETFYENKEEAYSAFETIAQASKEANSNKQNKFGKTDKNITVILDEKVTKMTPQDALNIFAGKLFDLSSYPNPTRTKRTIEITLNQLLQRYNGNHEYVSPPKPIENNIALQEEFYEKFNEINKIINHPKNSEPDSSNGLNIFAAPKDDPDASQKLSPKQEALLETQHSGHSAAVNLNPTGSATEPANSTNSSFKNPKRVRIAPLTIEPTPGISGPNSTDPVETKPKIPLKKTGQLPDDQDGNGGFDEAY